MIAKRWRLHDEAQRELEEAADWYEREATRGADFVAAFRAAYTRLQTFPASVRVVEGSREDVRRATLSSYPYLVVFVETDTEYVIVAVAHERRAPAYWASRLDR